MELKEYQTRALAAFDRWRNALTAAQLESEEDVAYYTGRDRPVPDEVHNYPKTAWLKLAQAGEVAVSAGPYVDRTSTAGFPIPHICFKVPTGGGKTLLAAGALERMNRPSGLVLWMVPSNAIYRQTKAALWSREHPYRQMLERASGQRVKMLEKDDLFTASDVEHYLCVMLISLQSANRKNNKEFLKMFQDSGRYQSFFPDNDDALGDARLRSKYPDLEPPSDERPVAQSLFNVFKMVRPVVILDEAHKAYGRQGNESDDFVQSVNRLNPSFVIELSATPSRRKSNLLVDIAGTDLRAEEMIKLPVRVASFTDAEWQYTLSEAHAQLELIENEALSLQHNEGKYIRPIAVVRVENTGKKQLDLDTVHAEDVRTYLTQNLGVPSAAVRVKSSENDELGNENLLDEMSPVRWIITRDALREGWDCSFAYLLVMLDNTRARTAITQLVGRVMRQPGAHRTGRELLDQCYVYCQDVNVNVAVQHVKDGLEQEGMTGLDDEVRSGGQTQLRPVTVQRRERFREAEFFLPKVLHQDDSEGWVELDYQRHIAPAIDWGSIGAPDLQLAQAQAPQSATASVDLAEADAPAVYDTPRELFIDTDVKINWYARRISHVMPNPFRAAKAASKLVRKMRDADFDDDAIYGQRSALAAQLREHVVKESDRLAEQVFRAKLANGEIRFDLETSDRNHRMRQSYEILVSDSDVLLQRYGQSVQLSLFEPVFDRDFNDLERRFAFYLDEQKALQWWHRVAVHQHGEHYLRGWRRERIWPDFVAMGGETNGKPSILVFETKGQHLDGNDDTEYKKRVFAALEETFNAGKMTIHDGPAKGVFRLVFDKEGFPDAEDPMSQLMGAYKA
ncbi:MAG: DEAD/DEAH box helicase family protein [Chloroflexi bacterium]|nr:DEAD/DEAH box helicase family protein [Chloroflexota bacterium]